MKILLTELFISSTDDTSSVSDPTPGRPEGLEVTPRRPVECRTHYGTCGGGGDEGRGGSVRRGADAGEGGEARTPAGGSEVRGRV